MSSVWKIEQLEVFPSFEGKSQVVKFVHWRVSKKRNTNLHAEAYGSVALETNDLSDFIPLEELTEEQVVAWVKDRLNAGAAPGGTVEQIEANLDAQLDRLETPPIETVAPPWGTTENL